MKWPHVTSVFITGEALFCDSRTCNLRCGQELQLYRRRYHLKLRAWKVGKGEDEIVTAFRQVRRKIYERIVRDMQQGSTVGVTFRVVYNTNDNVLSTIANRAQPVFRKDIWTDWTHYGADSELDELRGGKKILRRHMGATDKKSRLSYWRPEGSIASKTRSWRRYEAKLLDKIRRHDLWAI